MNRSALLPIILSAIISLAVQLSPVRADIVADGDVVPPLPWNKYQSAGCVGNTGYGTLIVDADDDLESSQGIIGLFSGSRGEVTVDGVGSTWTNTTSLDVGRYGSGRLDITDGGAVLNTSSFIGNYPGSTGEVTVDGDGSTWTNMSEFYVGFSGNGKVSVKNEGSLINFGQASIGGLPSSTGSVSINGTGSTWHTYSDLYIGHGGNGTLNITGGGDLISSYQSNYVHIGSTAGSTGVVEVAGEGSIWTNESTLSVGSGGSGTMTITDSGVVTSSGLSIGSFSGSNGIVTVDGKDSRWTTNGNKILYIGCYGNGALNIINGGTVINSTSNTGCYIGDLLDSNGVVTVSGADSLWSVTSTLQFGFLRLYIGGRGSGRLNITDGGSVSIHNCDSCMGFVTGSMGMVTVDGLQSNWTNSGALDVGSYGKGTLFISGGGAVIAESVSINSQSFLAIDVGHYSSLTIGSSGSGTITSDGTVRILVGAGVTTGGVYSPISATTWEGDGIYQAVGGTWNGTTHEFTVSDVLSGDSGVQVTLDLTDTQRALIADGGEGHTGWLLGASFLHKTGDDTALLLTATAIDTLGDLQLLIGENDSVLSAWNIELAGDGYAEDDPVYLSFDIGAGYNRGDLTVWHFDEGVWTEFDAMDLTVNDGWASFTATEFSGYAVTVPEPGTIVLLLIAALGLLAYAQSGRR